ncbi:MAG: DUF424 family protein [archaeon]
MILKKEHNYQGKRLIVLCDSSLIGKKLSENDLCLNISERFYKGEKLNESDLKELDDSVMFNLVGKESIKIALKYKLINKDKIIKIQKVPHAMVI